MPGLISLLIPLDWAAVCGAESSPEEFAPGVGSFCSRPLFPELGDTAAAWLNNNIVQAVVATVIVLAFWIIVSRNLKVVPGKRQFLGELAYNFVRNGIARDMLGHDFRRFTPYLVALFSFILVNNLFGQFVFMFPTFSKIGYAWGLALITFLIYNTVGIRKHGFLKYVKNNILPAGVPWFMWPLIIPLEFLSNFVIRPITLGLRLFANVFGGHLVVMVFVVGGSLLLTWANGPIDGKPEWLLHTAGGLALVFSLAIFALELFVSAMQAYIFTVLTAQYVSTALAEEH